MSIRWSLCFEKLYKSATGMDVLNVIKGDND